MRQVERDARGEGLHSISQLFGSEAKWLKPAGFSGRQGNHSYWPQGCWPSAQQTVLEPGFPPLALRGINTKSRSHSVYLCVCFLLRGSSFILYPWSSSRFAAVIFQSGPRVKMLSPGMWEISVEFSLMLFSGQRFELAFSRTPQEEETKRPPPGKLCKKLSMYGLILRKQLGCFWYLCLT